MDLLYDSVFGDCEDVCVCVMNFVSAGVVMLQLLHSISVPALCVSLLTDAD